MKRSPMKPGKPLARTPFKGTSPMPSTGMLSVQSHQRTAPKRKAGLKSKERAVTAAEKLMWTRLVDHVLTLKAGGKNVIANFQALCETCNRKKQREDKAAILAFRGGK